MKEIVSGQEQLFVKNAKLNFQVIPALKIENRNLECIHLISSAILSGHLNEVNLYNASFFGTKFSNVVFEKSNMRSADICSVWANGCQYLGCDFGGATISDSTFINCKFNASTFESVSLTKCQFIDCCFEQFSTSDSTISLNTFMRCQINTAQFRESFFYQIFEDCTFNHVDMDPELLGYNFGFSPVLCSKLSQGIDLDAVGAVFTEHGLYTNAAILRINQLQSCYDEALIACVVALGQMIQQDILIKADEIEFLKNLTAYLEKRQKIAPISILRIWQILTRHFMNDSPNTAESKAMPHIHEFANALYFDCMDFQKKLQRQLMQLPQSNQVTDTAELQIVYSEEPSLPLLDCLTELSSLASPLCPKPYLIRTEKGSFHEFHEIAVIVIPYIQTLLSLLGVVTPIIIYKKQKCDQIRTEKTQKETHTDEKREIEITIPVSAVDQGSLLIPNTVSVTPETTRILANVLKICGKQTFSTSPGFCGYNAQNIQSITIKIH